MIPNPKGGSGGGSDRRAAVVLSLLAAASSLAACNEGPARAALTETDRALVAARPMLERYVPAELGRIDADVADARARLARGRYTDALRIAQRLPGRVELAVAAAEAAKNEDVSAWTRLAAGIPPGLAAAAERLAGPNASPPLADQLAAAREAWDRAQAARAAGDVPQAIRLADGAQAKLDAIAASSKPTLAPRPRPATPRMPPAPSPEPTPEPAPEPTPGGERR